ncbi:MAG: magnesium transporter [Candidatus Izemoplasmatales bacterium]|mgnify:CR=1 FL=1|jgi:magnesium transporter|nr:magnesium transporter [Candidatus Izemoplasmatales bacterium]MDD4987322.1 magnesium transporter [Candidatus Izemoplasmatales bacterium]MDY0372884.1 magnesium transporter [Candidatus Izemoplasmatales bacterium]
MDNDDFYKVESDIIRLLNSDLPLMEKRESLDLFHDYELSQSLLVLDQPSRRKFARCFLPSQMASIISQLPPETAYGVLKDLPRSGIGPILNAMESDDLIDIIESIEEPEERVTFLSLINQTKRISIKAMLDYDDALVGSIMNNNYLEIQPENTVKEAIKTMVANAPEVEFINNLYVVDDGVLIGVLSLKEIISAGNQPKALIKDIMTENLITVTPWTKNEDAILLMKNYDFLLLPVVDQDGKILGVVAFDDMFEVLNKESDEDFSKLAAVSDVTIDIEKETIFSTVKKRLPWLIILLAINVITSSIITGFNSVLTMIPVLAVFMPLVLNLAGNTGTQSLGVVIRLFATNQLDTRKEIRKHLYREMITGIINGIAIAIMLFILVFLVRLISGDSFVHILPFALVIALSIAVALIISTLVGSLIPLVISFLKADPAVASGPFITTISDIISLLIYFGLASLMLASYL